MKQCPTCKLTYTDETLNFCLDDGTLLISSFDSEATVAFSPRYIPETPTEVIPKRQFPATIERSRSKVNLTYIVIIILAVLLAGSAVALFYEKGKENLIANTRVFEPVAANNANTLKTQQTQASEPVSNSNQSVSATRFNVGQCGSIKDSRTALEWYVGPDRNTTWDEAQQWVSALGTCNGGWRMPSIEEIKTLYNPSTKAGTGYFTGGKYFPARIDPIFNAIGGGSWVWSKDKTGNEARSFNLNQGKAVTYSANNTLYSTRAFAVRTARD